MTSSHNKLQTIGAHRPVTLLLAAHGSPVDPSVNQAITETAERIRRQQIFNQVLVAFHYGPPHIADAFQKIENEIVIIVPLMTSDGYLTRVVLQNAIDQAKQNIPEIEVVVANPVGTHKSIPDLLAGRISSLVHKYQLNASNTDVLLIGHGTRKHAASRNATQQLAANVNSGRTFMPRVSTAFIDDDPCIANALKTLHHDDVIVIPFLISFGPHAKIDIPRALGIRSTDEIRPTIHQSPAGRSVLDQPFGTWPQIDDLIVEQAHSALERQKKSNSVSGTVTLVGAGPGDPDLITVKGLDCLKKADVVVYDRLVSQDLLAKIPASAIKIDVGKKPKHHPVKQQTITQLLIDWARQGKNVVRLKGGDPFVFGRGYEELSQCRQNGVTCHIVPGISSALAAPARAGIPVTSRGIARSFAVITAESGQEFSDPNHDYQSLAKIDAVIVLMGRRKLTEITNRLMAAGRIAETPVTCIERATMADEKIVNGTLATIADRAIAANLQSPMVMIIGEVAGLQPDRQESPPSDGHSLRLYQHLPVDGFHECSTSKSKLAKMG